MSHRRVTRLRLAEHAWPEAWTRLRARLAAADDLEAQTLQWVRVDADTALLVVGTALPETLARISSAILEPWLAEFGVDAATSWSGPIVFDQHDHDAALDEGARCDRFVRDVVAAATVWGLYDSTWARSDAAGRREALPLWSTRDHAARCVAGPWQTFAPRAIALGDFVAQWLTGMDEDGIAAVVGPTPRDRGVIVEPAALAAALRRAGAG